MADRALIRTNEPPRLHVVGRLGTLLRRREVLLNLTRKEMKVKYKSSVLGVVWSMLNPLLYLMVFYVVFTYFLRSGIPDFAVYLLAGLLPWTLFSTGFQGATSSVVDNASLVTKVAFPHEMLPLSLVGASLVNFFFQFLVLIGFMLVVGYGFLGPNLLLLPLALAVLLLFTVAISLLASAVNVRYRDATHLVALALVAWFWVTPIVYPASLVRENIGGLAQELYFANPMTVVALGFQRALYGFRVDPEGGAVLPDPGVVWYAERLGMLGVASVALLYLAWRRFFRMSGDFAEEL
ncbi:MAG: ABC transporter permease [Actinomycetota bacterium]|nr:ABC transporter permease [Actinomycetota bacterium]